MIHKNVKYGAVENVTVVEFGTGTIMANVAENNELKLLILKTAEQMPIGAEEPRSKENYTTDDFKPEVVVAFRNIESFKVFYEMVERVRGMFLKDLEK